MVTYNFTKELCHSDEIGEYDTFGINVFDGNKKIKTLHDVFLNEDDARRCVSLFNEEQLDVIHLEQIVDEYLQFGF